MKVYVALSLLVGCLVVGAIVGISDGSAGDQATALQLTSQGPQNSDNVIDGSQTPELIPDGVAYSMFFQFLASRQQENQRKSLRSYFEQTALEGADFDAVLAIADDFKRRVRPLDQEAQEIRNNSSHGDAAARARLDELQLRRDGVASEVIASLPGRLSPADLNRVRRHINERVKRKIKIVPGPMMPSEHSVQ